MAATLSRRVPGLVPVTVAIGWASLTLAGFPPSSERSDPAPATAPVTARPITGHDTVLAIYRTFDEDTAMIPVEGELADVPGAGDTSEGSGRAWSGFSPVAPG